MKYIESIKKALAKGTEWVCVFMVALLTILSIVSVVLRYIFNIVFIQTEELITFLFVATCFLGAVSVMYKKEHVGVALIQAKMPKKVQKVMVVLQYIIIIAVNFLLIYCSYKWIRTNIGYTTPGLRIPYWTVYIVLPISCLLSAIVAILQLIEVIVIPEMGIVSLED